VHFHPHAAPLLLTAEVNDLDSPDSPMTLATSPGYLQYPPPAVFFTPVRPHTGSGNSVSGVNSAPLMPFPYLFWPAAFVSESNVQSSQADGMVVETAASTRQIEGEVRPLSESPNDQDFRMQSTAWAAPMDVSPRMPHGGLTSELINDSRHENAFTDRQSDETANNVYGFGLDTLRPTKRDVFVRDRQRNSPIQESEDVVFSNGSVASGRNQPGTTSYLGESSSRLPPSQARQVTGTSRGISPLNTSANVNLQLLLGNGSSSQLHRFYPVGDHTGWELPFLQGWLMGQSHAGLSTNLPMEGSQGDVFGMPNMPSESHPQQQSHGVSLLSSTTAGIASARVAGRFGGRHRSHSRLNAQTGTGISGMFAGDGITGMSVGEDAVMNIANEDRDLQPNLGAVEAEAAAAHASMAAAAAAAAAELPCTVKLRIWPHNVKEPSALLDPETCRLTIPHAVLCSEMGAHFSPCGRFLAACVACVLPQQELEAGMQSQSNQGATGIATSPTRHPISVQQVVYELRIYSLEEATFGEVLASRAIRAAHCLTSIQFSPTSAHILLAYGRRHNSLLRSIVVDGTVTIPIYTILEIYKVSNMELVRVLPSAEDEVNVACFHPLVGGGLVYGTKEGKLRILQYDRTHGPNYGVSSSGIDHNMFEVQTVALEC
jgi:activator-of-BECN1-regulated-autophagy protein 1